MDDSDDLLGHTTPVTAFRAAVVPPVAIMATVSLQAAIMMGATSVGVRDDDAGFCVSDRDPAGNGCREGKSGGDNQITH